MFQNQVIHQIAKFTIEIGNFFEEKNNINEPTWQNFIFIKKR